MVWRDEAAFRRVEPLLRQLGRTVTRVADNGAGVLLTLAINISRAVQTPAFSEGVLLAARADIDPRPGVEAMGASSIGSPMLQTRLPSLRNLPDDALFTIRLLRKDIHLALDEAQRLAVPLRSAAVAADILTKADALGYANRDIAGIHEVLDRLSRSTV